VSLVALEPPARPVLQALPGPVDYLEPRVHREILAPLGLQGRLGLVEEPVLRVPWDLLVTPARAEVQGRKALLEIPVYKERRARQARPGRPVVLG